jgi:hypothetical protein
MTARILETELTLMKMPRFKEEICILGSSISQRFLPFPSCSIFFLLVFADETADYDEKLGAHLLATQPPFADV